MNQNKKYLVNFVLLKFFLLLISNIDILYIILLVLIYHILKIIIICIITKNQIVNKLYSKYYLNR